MTVTEAAPGQPASPPGGQAAPPQLPKEYRISVLATGIGRFFRGFVPFVLIIVVNALVQALLVLPNQTPGLNVAFIAACLASFLVLIGSFRMLNATALRAVSGRVTVRTVLTDSRRHLGLFVLWSVAVYVLVILGLILYTIPGLIVMAITPFVPLAAADGKRNALGANFRAIGSRFFRYLITVVIMGVILVVSYLLAVLNGFLIGGFLAALLLWLYFGLLAAWFLCALASLYRSTRAGAVAPADGGGT